MIIHRRRWLLILSILLLPVGGCGTSNPLAGLPAGRTLNVVIVSFDALRADMLGAYGNPSGLTPNMDRLADRGVLYDCAYTPGPATPTALAAAFTGLLPHVSFQRWRLTSDQTVAKTFRLAGFRTAGFFNNAQLTPKRGFDAGFNLYHYEPAVDSILKERAVQWLSRHRNERLFAWLHLVSTHAPYQVREVSRHLYDPDYSGRFTDSSGLRFEAEDRMDIQRILELYRGEVFYADHLFGEFLESLKQLGLMENSIIVLTADHGEAFMERGVFQHLHLFDETIRIPLIIHHPGISQPYRESACVSLIDLLPTLVGMAGIDADLTTHGWSLKEALPAERPIVSIAMTSGKYQGVALRQGALKLISTCVPERKDALYDLDRDPGEKVDLSGNRPEETRRLRQLVAELLGSSPCETITAAVRGASPTRGLDPKTIERLRSLGYIR